MGLFKTFVLTHNKYFIYYLLVIYAGIAGLTIFYFNGTGDDGDSVTHYLFAKYAPLHPALFFDHWAKPLFVLLASPFVQFGFVGVKVFNAINVLISIFLTYRTAVTLHLKNALISGVMMICGPLYYVLTFSGLTEPLFGCFIIGGVLLAAKGKQNGAAVLVSFLPFIRSEGLIILGVFGLYFLLNNNRKSLLLLAMGSVIYSVAGWFVYDDLLWVFSKIPYATLNSVYGKGELFHFIYKLNYITGVPVFILFWAGVLAALFNLFKSPFIIDEKRLVFLCCLAFVVGHSLFWYLGIFNSMGLIRVLIGIMPLLALIGLQGFNLITEEIKMRGKYSNPVIQFLILAYIIAFPFTPNHAAVHFQKDMTLNTRQREALSIANFIKVDRGTSHQFLFNYHYLGDVLEIDYFDRSFRVDLNAENISEMKPGDMIIWQSDGFADIRVPSEQLLNENKDLERIYFHEHDDVGSTGKSAVYERRH